MALSQEQYSYFSFMSICGWKIFFEYLKFFSGPISSCVVSQLHMLSIPSLIPAA